jgi:hypothetical protein
VGSRDRGVGGRHRGVGRGGGWGAEKPGFLVGCRHRAEKVGGVGGWGGWGGEKPGFLVGCRHRAQKPGFLLGLGARVFAWGLRKWGCGECGERGERGRMGGVGVWEDGGLRNPVFFKQQTTNNK